MVVRRRKMNYVHLQTDPIKLDDLYQRVVASSCGAVSSFIGMYSILFNMRCIYAVH